MQKLPLPTNWTVRAVSNLEEVPSEIQNLDIPAVVPGCVHLDLLRENLIPDPYLGMNETLVQWIGRTDWEYTTTFSVSPEALDEERVDLVCEGLDTVATIWVNGVEVGRSENMHIESRFDVKAAILQGLETRIVVGETGNSPGEMAPLSGGTPFPPEVVAFPSEKIAVPPEVLASPPGEITVLSGGIASPPEVAPSPQGAMGNGEHEIRIRFASPVLYARAMRDKLGDLPHANSYPDCEPFHFIRKNASNFGWDWGPALITSGIWKAIRLEAWSVARIKSVRPLVKVANEKVAFIDVTVELERSYGVGKGAVTAEIIVDGDAIDAFDLSDEDGSREVLVRKPKVWWPRGYGEQHLIELSVRIVGDLVPNGLFEEEEKDDLDVWTAKIGLREIELDQTPDEIGAKWALKVNGQEIWCKGANWIPDDVFLTRASEPARLRERLEQACAMGMNTIRVWGGGIYETDEFYSLCDELGLLVWQDFPFACAAYSEESPMRELVIEEARQNVARLAKHPSLALWNGCNENIWGWFDWGWEEKVGPRTWGAGYYLDILPKIVSELDPTRPYNAGSPFSGSMDIHPNADAYGTKHIWDTWNEVSHTHFRKYSPRFASEFGHQAPPTFSTLARAVPEDQRDPYSPTMLLHQKAAQGNAKLHARLAEHFEIPSNFDDWLFLTQLVQARAMTTAVEWFRTRGSCSGALFWQLNDCWPVTSWSAIDGDGRPKPLFYAAKQFFAERLLSIQPDGEHLALWAHNDAEDYWTGEVTVRLLSMDGEEKNSTVFDFFADPRELVNIGQLKDFHPTDKSNELLSVHFRSLTEEYIGAIAFWFFDTDKNLAYPEPKFEATLEGSTLRITAQTLIRDLYINADRVGAVAEFNLVTLLPGETWRFEVSGGQYDLETLTSRPVLTCANWFGKRS